MNTILIQVVVALGIFLSGVAGGIRWHAGQDAIAEQRAAELRKTDEKQQRKFGDDATLRHATTVASISNQLGDAREKIAQLSGRECLDAGTVGMLNAIGGDPVRAPAADAASAPAATAPGTGIRFATDRDAGSAIATCRSRYAEVVDQLNQVLDIEDRRHPAWVK